MESGGACRVIGVGHLMRSSRRRFLRACCRDFRFSYGWYERHPPFHFYMLAFLFTPFAVLQQLRMIDILSLPIYTILFYIARLLSVAMGTGAIYIIYLCGREIYDKRAAIFAALIVALVTPFIFYSKTANLDIPYIFWFVLSLFFYIRILKNHETKDYILFTITATLSICTKDQAYGLYILPVIYIIYDNYIFKRKN
jgi:4-amino-4-deoxy-L-arabinose transferase-like glycosyltransferase